jgi:hypothetical protein
MRIGTIFLTIEDGLIVARYRDREDTERAVVIDSEGALDHLEGRLATELGEAKRTVGIAIFTSSSLDFPTEYTDNAEVITLAAALRGEG